MSLGQKKGNFIFEEQSNLYLNLLLTCFSRLLLWIPTENRTKLNYFFELQNQAEHNITKITTATDYSLATTIMLVTFWTELDFWIVPDCRNSFKSKLLNF